ncbi:MAG: acyl-CoA synthetase FdrA [Elusimicrobia bacterium]|nr:acyl-CoA synthetase FdrA [Elusimicrobiota bacterium]
MIKTIVKKGAYFDSVTLMNLAKDLRKIQGVDDAAVVMATPENKSILKSSGLYDAETLAAASDNDLVIALKTKTNSGAETAAKKAEELLKPKSSSHDMGVFKSGQAGHSIRAFDSLEAALNAFQGANIALISVAGKYAGALALKCLYNNLNLMIFSDNVPLETEIQLKKTALKKGILAMGPDCGTAIINGTPLGFANSVRRGGIGIAAASGTGLQEVSCLLNNMGFGISQAIGTGSRDVKKEVGAVTMIQGLKALANDPDTLVIVIISKPPHPDVLKKIAGEIKKIKKPVVSVFLGGELKIPDKKNFYNVPTLEKAAMNAAVLCDAEKASAAKQNLYNAVSGIEKIAQKALENKTAKQKFIRGLFSGGTFASETQIILKDFISPVWSNAPIVDKWKLKNPLNLKGHSVVDLGADEFTQGRPHPMIDYSLRNSLIISESKKKEVSVILLDVVLGYGANMNPLDDILPAIKTAFKNNPGLSIITSVTGTETDPQVCSKVVQGLEKTGVIVMPSNAAACRLAGTIARGRRIISARDYEIILRGIKSH